MLLFIPGSDLIRVRAYLLPHHPQRLSTAGSCARAERSLITSRIAQQREMTFPAAYWTEAEALARAEKWRAILEAGPRMLQIPGQQND